MKVPDDGDTVFVTVGTMLPREDRALVKGTAVIEDTLQDGTFILDHEEVIDVGSYYENLYTDNERLSDGESGPYGEPYDELYGEVWAYDLEDLK